MPRYSKQLKEKILKQMLPPENMKVSELSKQHKISEQTLYKWKKEAKEHGAIIQSHSKGSEKYTNEVKLNIIIETAHLNQQELSEYCRKKGLYVDEINAWKSTFIRGKNTSDTEFKEELKSKDAELKSVKKELSRKEKALAEAAALLVLRKKMNAIWSSDEED